LWLRHVVRVRWWHLRDSAGASVEILDTSHQAPNVKFDIRADSEVASEPQQIMRERMTELEFYVRPKDGEIQEALRQIRRRRLVMWAVFLGYLPIAGGLAALLRWITGRDWVVIAVAALWMFWYAVRIFMVNESRCPRCGERFHRRGLWFHPLARSCLHCELPIRATTANG